jgi:hypothetical protein
MSGRKFVGFAAVIGMGVTGLRAETMRFTRNEFGLCFEASGEITLATPHDFMEAGVPRGATVSLDSPGGNVEAAMESGRLIRLRELQTEVAPGGSCASACVWAFAGGRDRIYRFVPVWSAAGASLLWRQRGQWRGERAGGGSSHQPLP